VIARESRRGPQFRELAAASRRRREQAALLRRFDERLCGATQQREGTMANDNRRLAADFWNIRAIEEPAAG
jgi:hypothetical protein